MDEMREETIKIFTFEELNEKIQKKVVDAFKFSEENEYFWHDENTNSLDEFEKIFPIHSTGYEYSYCGKWINTELNIDEQVSDIENRMYSNGFNPSDYVDDIIENMSGIRLMKYMYNNYYNRISKGRYYSTNGVYVDGKYTSKHRYSKVTKTIKDCNLTGYCIDMELLEPIVKCMNGEYINTGETFKDVMEQCLENWIKACYDDYCGIYEDDYVREKLMDDDKEYLEDGTKY